MEELKRKVTPAKAGVDIPALDAAVPEPGVENINTARDEMRVNTPVEQAPVLDAVKAAATTAEVALQNAQNAQNAEQVSLFISRYANISLYPTVNGRTVRVDFRHGVFSTSNADLAAALRLEKRFGRTFSETTNSETAVMREAIDRQRGLLKSATQAGMDTSTNGVDAVVISQGNALDAAEANLMREL